MDTPRPSATELHSSPSCTVYESVQLVAGVLVVGAGVIVAVPLMAYNVGDVVGYFPVALQLDVKEANWLARLAS